MVLSLSFLATYSVSDKLQSQFPINSITPKEVRLLKTRSSLLTLFLTATIVALIPVAAHAQDPFEIQVYEYETVPKGMWNLETHVNYVGQGTKSFEGAVAPTNNQFHLTYELTRGITDISRPPATWCDASARRRL